MEKKRLLSVISAEKAVEIINAHGWHTNIHHVYAGLACGAYPFGVAIPMGKSTVYEVYEPLLLKWIDERSMEVTA